MERAVQSPGAAVVDVYCIEEAAAVDAHAGQNTDTFQSFLVLVSKRFYNKNLRRRVFRQILLF